MARRAASDESDLRKRIFRIVRKNKVCDLDELILECTSYSWTAVFVEVDQLSRAGKLRLLSKRPGEYMVTMPRAA
jgi:hypothetical protein